MSAKDTLLAVLAGAAIGSSSTIGVTRLSTDLSEEVKPLSEEVKQAMSTVRPASEGAEVGTGCEIGVGECTNRGVFLEVDGKLVCSVLSPGQPKTEDCANALDDDCDGAIDESCLTADDPQE